MNFACRRPSVRPATLFLLGISGVVMLSCATTAPRSTRVKDSPAEKSAAQNAGDPHAESEAAEQRWGFDAARDRKRRSDEEKRKQATTPTPGGPVDLKQPPTPKP